MKVYVSGATGFVGSHVARELREQGGEVRDERVDLLDSAGLERVLDGCDAVVHVAALYSYEAPEPEFQRVNVEGTRTILAAAQARGVRRFLFTSTAGTCGPVPGAIATEEDEPPEWELSVPYKRTKLESERLALAAGAVVVNPTTPVGDGDARPTPTGQMIEDVATGRIRGYVATTGLNVVDVRDVARGSPCSSARALPPRGREPFPRGAFLRHRRPRRSSATEAPSPVSCCCSSRESGFRERTRGQARAHTDVFFLGKGSG